MRRFEKEIKDPAIINEILHRSELCRIGLVDGVEAYIVPLNYGYADGVLYFHSAPKGRKIDLVRKCNHVSFEITYISEIHTGEKPCNWTSRYRSVMGTGTIEISDDRESKISGLDVIMKKYGAEGDLNYDDALLGRMVILKLHINTLNAKQSGFW
jgi:nitroimidazol reductase NimA-like FMN-containing flavoprotein (pyridoxamine 5'-phosphate oxidase superfamily)